MNDKYRYFDNKVDATNHFLLVSIEHKLIYLCSSNDFKFVLHLVPKSLIGFIYFNILLFPTVFFSVKSSIKMSISTITRCYGPTESENTRSLDLYFPPQADKSSPLIVFIHGGAWRTEDKADYRQLCTGFSELGYSCASVNYR